jgi:hypothetical protein
MSIMIRWLASLFVFVSVSAHAGDQGEPLCSDAWYRSVEQRVSTGDGRGHGPDVGSDEWKSTIEFKLGIRDQVKVPPRDDEAWCGYIDRLVQGRAPRATNDAAPVGIDGVQGPSFACDKLAADSVEAMVCADEELSALATSILPC